MTSWDRLSATAWSDHNDFCYPGSHYCTDGKYRRRLIGNRWSDGDSFSSISVCRTEWE